jgi:hypothetical protein
MAQGALSWRLKIYDYAAARTLMIRRPRDFPFYRCVLVGWDNTPRRGPNGIVIVNSTPERLTAALQEALNSVVTRPPEDRLVFLNAWNEWAEGNHLEPDHRYGLGHLEAITAAMSAYRATQLPIDLP